MGGVTEIRVVISERLLSHTFIVSRAPHKPDFSRNYRINMVMKHMITRKTVDLANPRRGAPCIRRDPPEDKDARQKLAELEEELGLTLHPLVRRLPAPTDEEIGDLMVRFELGWSGAVAYVAGSKKLLVGGLANLAAWHGLGRSIDDIPAECIRTVDDEAALESLLTDQFPWKIGWKDSRKAAAAAVFGNEITADLLRFQLLSNFKGGSTAAVLGHFAGVSEPLMEKALWTMTARPELFRKILFNGEGSLPQGKDRPNSAHRGARAPKTYEPISIDVRKPDVLAVGDRAHLAILDNFGRKADLWTRLDAQAIVVYIQDVEFAELGREDFMTQTIANISSGEIGADKPFPFQFQGMIAVPLDNGATMTTQSSLRLRLVGFLTFGSNSFKGGIPSLPTSDLNKFQENLGCREKIYELLIGHFCHKGSNRVFAPYAISAGKRAKNILKCFAGACRDRGAVLINYA